MSIGSHFVLYLFQNKIIYNFVKFRALKKGKATNFISTSPSWQPHSRVSDPDPDWIRIGPGFNRASGSGSGSESGSGSSRAKMTHKSRKKLVKVHVLKGWTLLRAEGFLCNFDILYGGLGIGKLQFLIQKNLNFFSAVFFLIFGH